MNSYGAPNQWQDQIQRMLTSQITNQQSQEQHVVRVNGRGGADNFFLPPNSDAILLDINDPIAWFVQTDGAGYKTITPYDISIHKEKSQNDVLKSMEERISKLEEVITNGKPDFTANHAKPRPKSKPGFDGNVSGNRSDDQG